MAPASSPPERAVLLTRPLEDSRAFAERLAEDGIASEIWPLTRIVPVMTELRLPPTVDGVVATSAHGLRALAALTGRRDLPVLAVGARTAGVARGLGFGLVLEAGGDAGSLADLARRAGLRHLVYPRGREVARDLAAEIGPGGPRLTEAVLYAAEETGPPPAPVAHALASGRIAAVTVWSARNAEILARHFRRAPPPAGPPTFVAISEAAGKPLDAAGFGGIVHAAAPTSGQMHAAIRGVLAPGGGTR